MRGNHRTNKPDMQRATSVAKQLQYSLAFNHNSYSYPLTLIVLCSRSAE